MCETIVSPTHQSMLVKNYTKPLITPLITHPPNFTFSLFVWENDSLQSNSDCRMISAVWSVSTIFISLLIFKYSQFDFNRKANNTLTAWLYYLPDCKESWSICVSSLRMCHREWITCSDCRVQLNPNIWRKKI